MTQSTDASSDYSIVSYGYHEHQGVLLQAVYDIIGKECQTLDADEEEQQLVLYEFVEIILINGFRFI